MKLYVNYFVRRRTPILVYSMERSGSVALHHSLQSHGAFVIGAHYLDPQKLATQRHSGSAGWASKHIVSKRARAKVISLVRNPIENMLSTFAREEFGRLSFEEAEKNKGDQMSPQQLSDHFCRVYLQADRHLKILGWFENELQAALGIDVYQYEFDAIQGFAHIHEEPFELLIMRTELEDNLKAGLVAEFVNLPKLGMSNALLASQTSAAIKRRTPPGMPGDQAEYAVAYKKLKQHAVIPPEYLDAIVDSPYVRHFFTDEQRQQMRNRYGRHSVDQP